MPTITERPAPPGPLEAPRKQWTRVECAILEESGVWDQQHLELINGEVIRKMPKKRRHSIAETIVRLWLERVFGGLYVDQEAPIDVAPEDNPTSEPVPDLIVLARPSQEIRDANPGPKDLRLVIKIADTTVRFDLTIKADLYARAGIPEYWVFDLPARRLVVHRDPRDGAYRSVQGYSEQESASPLTAPDQQFRVAEAFGG